MRIANVSGRLSLVGNDASVDVEKASDGRFSSDPHDIYARWDEFRDWAESASPAPDAELDPLQLGPPSPTPRQVFATALELRRPRFRGRPRGAGGPADVHQVPDLSRSARTTR